MSEQESIKQWLEASGHDVSQFYKVNWKPSQENAVQTEHAPFQRI